MLGRFRMTVKDCLYEYEHMGQRIFGHPRRLHQLNTIVLPVDKFSAEKMEEAFKDVAYRRGEVVQGGVGPVNFETLGGLCNV